jgi:hypothetical protein
MRHQVRRVAALGWAKALPNGQALEFPVFLDIADEMVKVRLTTAQANRVGLGILVNFCGGYVNNTFSELQHTVIELDTGHQMATAPSGGTFISGEILRSGRPLHALARSSESCCGLETRFHLPFLYTIGAEPAASKHTILVIPTIRQEQLNG